MPWQSSSLPSGPNLSGVDGRRIPCWGERPFTVTIGGLPHQWRFLLAAVSFPILGVDFLRHHSLAVDVANLRLFSPPPVVGPGAADQGLTEVKAPSGFSVPPATAGPFSSVAGAVTPGWSYADAVRSLPGAPPPTRAGAHISAGGSSSPSSSPAVAAAACGWPAARAGAPPLLPGSLPPLLIGWWHFSASFLRCFFRMPPPLPLPPHTACSTSSRQQANQLPPNSSG
jgi:hypothetical protein